MVCDLAPHKCLCNLRKNCSGLPYHGVEILVGPKSGGGLLLSVALFQGSVVVGMIVSDLIDRISNAIRVFMWKW